MTATRMDKYIQRYLNSLTNQSENTIKIYTKDLEMFNDYMNSEGISIITATLDDLQGYAKYLKVEKGYAEATSNRRLQLVKYLYKYLHRSKAITENPSEYLELPKIPERLPNFLTLTESKKLLRTIDKEKNIFLRRRDKAMIMIFLSNGLRVSEITTLTTDSIKGDKMTFIGKGNKERMVVLSDDTINVINEYLEVRPKVDTKNLFINTHKNPVKVRAIQLTFEKYMSKAGLNSHGIHSLRHSAAVIMLEQGIGIRTIQELYGHKDVKTTEIYASVTEGSKRDAANRVNGLFTS